MGVKVNLDRYAAERLRDGITAATKCESDPLDVMRFLIGYIASYDPDINQQCLDILDARGVAGAKATAQETGIQDAIGRNV
jgi:hypothetical protein